MSARGSGRRSVRGQRRVAAGALRPRVKSWVILPNGTKLGVGRARLFELIDELGSIRSAVTQLGMSYRAAWGYITELEEAAGFTILARKPGGGGTRGAHLTREGRAFLARYRRFRESIDRTVQRQFMRAFKAP